MHIVLFEPEIPPNTGNVARLCAAAQVELHLVEPLGYSLEDRYLKRAGLDYWPHVRLFVWPNLAAYLEKAGQGKRLVASSSRSGTAVHRFPFSRDDAILLGPETRGLPEEVLALTPHRVRIPITGQVRSLNLSTAAGILLAQAMAVNGMFDDAEESLAAEAGGEGASVVAAPARCAEVAQAQCVETAQTDFTETDLAVEPGPTPVFR